MLGRKPTVFPTATRFYLLHRRLRAFEALQPKTRTKFPPLRNYLKNFQGNIRFGKFSIALLLFYQKYPPSALLKPFVECYFVWEWDIGAVPRTVDSPPNGFTSLVINYGNSYKVSDSRSSERETPTAFLSGQFTTRYQLQLGGSIGMAGIVFKPSGMSSFFKVPMYELTGERLCFESIFGKDGKELVSKIGDSPSPLSKVSLFEAFLSRQMQQANPSDLALDVAANTIVKNNGIVKMDDLLSRACMSRRNFERRFLERVGVSPKYYARLRRISRICYQMGSAQKVDWQRLIGTGDYYDQAHFIKDFRDFMGEAPSVYAENNAELFRFLDRR